MGNLRNTVILAAIAVFATILKSTGAAEYTVGDSTDWTSSVTGGASFYSDWASKIAFKEGDILVFKFSGSHTVAELTDKASFDNCNVNQNNEVISTSPARITLNRTGEFYFTCTIGGHCNAGQKLSVSVTGSSPSAPRSAPSPPPSSDGTPPPQSTPTEPGSTTPPPSPGSATSSVSTFSFVLISIAINSLFRLFGSRRVSF